MKKMFFLAAVSAAFLMTACGGAENKEDDKKEKKEVSEETKAKFDELQTQWTTIDAQFIAIGMELDGHNADAFSTKLDSLKGVAEKAKADVKTQVLPLLDTLAALNGQVADWKTIFEGEKTTWGTITEDFTQVKTEIEKGEADGEKVAARAEGFTEQFKYKSETLTEIYTNWEKIKTTTSTVEQMLAPAK